MRVVVDGTEVIYTGTIHSLHCSGNTLSSGKHPYQCVHCYGLVHGNNSSLLRKYNHSKTLKHPRSDSTRATKVGVTHNFCSPDHIESALHVKTVKMKAQKDKAERLNTKLQKILSILEVSLIVDKKLSEFDISCITNWLGKKVKGQYFRGNLQSRSLAVLYCNRLGQKSYAELAPVMGLPCQRQVQNLKESCLRTKFICQE